MTWMPPIGEWFKSSGVKAHALRNWRGRNPFSEVWLYWHKNAPRHYGKLETAPKSKIVSRSHHAYNHPQDNCFRTCICKHRQSPVWWSCSYLSSNITFRRQHVPEQHYSMPTPMFVEYFFVVWVVRAGRGVCESPESIEYFSLGIYLI